MNIRQIAGDFIKALSTQLQEKFEANKLGKIMIRESDVRKQILYRLHMYNNRTELLYLYRWKVGHKLDTIIVTDTDLYLRSPNINTSDNPHNMLIYFLLFSCIIYSYIMFCKYTVSWCFFLSPDSMVLFSLHNMHLRAISPDKVNQAPFNKNVI